MPRISTPFGVATFVAATLTLSIAGPIQTANAQQGKTTQQSAQPTGQTPATTSPLDKIPKVVAVVNGQTISRDTLADECLKRYGTIVLDNLLNKHLILQACKAKGISITQADISAEINRVASKFGLTYKLFLQAIEQERDITAEQYSSEIVWPMLALRALAADKINVTDQEIEQAIRSQYGPRVQVRMIAVSDAAKAQELHAEVTANPDQFRRVAQEQSEDAASASVYGLLPPIRNNGGQDELERIAFQLQPNQISHVFQIGEMHVMLQCNQHLAATPPSPQLLPAIQQRIADELRDARLGTAADEIFASLQKNSQVVTIIGNAELEQKYPGVAAYINQQPVPRTQLAAECIARHGKEILRGEINRLLLNNALKTASKVVSQQDITDEVARAADTMGYIKNDGTPDPGAWLKSITEEEGASVELYIADAVWPSVALKKLVEDEVQITQEDLQKGFEANFGPRAEVLAVVLSNQRTAEEVFRKAREELTEQNFGQLAAQYSIEPVSRSNFGKVPALRRHGGQPTLEEAAFQLAPGQISGVIALKDQYVVLYKQGESSPIVQDFEAVRGELEKEIREKKLRVAMSKKLDTMLGAAQIENFIEPMVQMSGPVVPVAGTQSTGQVTPAVNR
ncbi:MAG: peptidylprolyl isomerase [Pirellulaceae bacterium]